MSVRTGIWARELWSGSKDGVNVFPADAQQKTVQQAKGAFMYFTEIQGTAPWGCSGSSGLAINNIAKPMTPQGTCQMLRQKHRLVMITEEKLPVITYDAWRISSVITKLGRTEFWRQNAQFWPRASG